MNHRIALAAVLSLVSLCGCQTTVVQTIPRATDAASATLPSDRERDLYLSVIGQLVDHGKFYAALAHLDEFERLHGPTDASRKLRGDAWVAVGALDNAEAEYTAITEGRLSGFGEHGLGRVAAARDDWTSASRHFERAVGQQPTNTQFLQDFASALYELGRVNEAEFQLRKALELSASDSPSSETLRTLLATHKRTALVRAGAPEVQASAGESANAATPDARNAR
jgi:tetratricopeptide (TPR) repeat protein